LITAVPWSVYSGNSEILPAVLKEIAKCFQSLFYDGVTCNGAQYWFALIGCKGDAEFHVEAGELTRSYQTVGTKNSIPMCPYCEAADDFGDVSDSPSWLPTVSGTRVSA